MNTENGSPVCVYDHRINGYKLLHNTLVCNDLVVSGWIWLTLYYDDSIDKLLGN